MSKKLFIPLLLGTMRQGRESEKAACLLFKHMEEHPEIETMFFDTREMILTGDEGQELKKKNPEYRDAIIRADGLIIVAPEYNHSFPGSLKMTLDMLLKEYIHKVVGICSVSAGGFGGARMVESLVNVVRELGLVVTFTDLNFSRVHRVFDEAGNLKEESVSGRIGSFLEELIWMSKAMRWGRENVPSKYH